MTEPVRNTQGKKRALGRKERMRAAGLRPLHIWVPDTKDPQFEAKVRQQAKALAAHDPAGEEVMDWVEVVYEAPEWKE